jgi:hypothetical protein
MPAPDPNAPVEVRTVTITSVQPVLWSVAGPDGGLVLLPAYRFLADDGGQYDVLAVPDELVQVVSPPVQPVPEPVPLPETIVPETTPAVLPPPVTGEPLPRPVPLPGDTTGTPDPTVDPAVADPAVALAYVGLSEEEALRKAEAEGRPIRVVARDGAELTLTADFVEDRVNLVVVAGVVADARLG